MKTPTTTIHTTETALGTLLPHTSATVANNTNTENTNNTSDRREQMAPIHQQVSDDTQKPKKVTFTLHPRVENPQTTTLTDPSIISNVTNYLKLRENQVMEMIAGKITPKKRNLEAYPEPSAALERNGRIGTRHTQHSPPST